MSKSSTKMLQPTNNSTFQRATTRERCFKFRSRPSLVVFITLFSILVLIYYLHLIGGFNSLSFTNNKVPLYRWRPEFSSLNGPEMDASSPELLKKLSKEMRKESVPFYKLTNVSLEYDPSMGQSQLIRKFFHEKKNGFFIECGALDGETRSNTLYMERALGWDGILIEADPNNFLQLKDKGRAAWVSGTCLSVNYFPQVVSFEQKENQGRISSSYTAGYIEKGFVDVQCYPFETYMKYLNRTSVDYFSLDVEGVELQILKTIDFKKFDIKSLSVEFIHDKEGKEAIRLFMEQNGYRVLAQVTHPNWLANDFIFVKEDETK